MYDDSIFNSNSASLDLNPTNFPKKYQKFVGELNVLLENVKLGNVNNNFNLQEFIDNSDCKQPIDETLSSIMHNLKNLEKNLML